MKSVKWNENWKFWQEHNSFALIWNTPDDAQSVTLPHDAMIERTRNPNSTNGGNTGYRDGGVYIYTKSLEVGDLDDGIYMLQFDGVYAKASVFVNGQLAGKNLFGYSTFYVDITDFLVAHCDNEIRVQVRTGDQPNSRWYSGTGIYRDVYLLTSGRTFIEPNGVTVTTEECDRDHADVQVRTTIANHDGKGTYALRVAVRDANGEVVVRECSPVVMPGGAAKTVTQRLCVERPALWSAEHPDLYQVELSLECDGQTVDKYRCRTGIRRLGLDSRRGFCVNGEPVKLRGAGIHHDSGIIGAVTLESTEMRRVRILKEAGFNAIRIAHQPAAPALLRACDRVGMYVMDESFDMWNRSKSDYDYSLDFQESWRQDVELMVRKDINHPSVVLYSIGNEIPEIATDQGLDLCSQMYGLIKSIDPTRYVLAAVNGMYTVGNDIMDIVAQVAHDEENVTISSGNVNEFMTYMDKYLHKIVTHPAISGQLEKVSTELDVVGYNYMSARYDDDARNYPNRLVLGSETYPPEIAYNWERVLRHPQILGDFTWTGWDYLGEAGVGVPSYRFGDGGFGATYPAATSYVADIDITGFRRPMSYYREIVFGLRTKPFIAVQDPHRVGQDVTLTPWILSDAISSWSWKVDPGSPVVVEVYSAGDEVELLLDGSSLGRRPAGPSVGYRTLFETVYQPGRLVAVTYSHGEAIGEMTLDSAGEVSRIVLRPETPADAVVAEESHDLQYVDLALCDDAGGVVTDDDVDFTVEVSGGAHLYAVGSADPRPTFEYRSDRARTFHGRGLVIVERDSTGRQAELRVVTASGIDAHISL